jgi:DNA primase
MRQPTKPVIKSFDKRTLPEDSEPLDSTLPAHKKYTDYLLNRGLSPTDYQYYVTPTELGRDADRIIVPYMYQGSLVGYTSRYLDGRVPKYVSDQQRGYVFNLDAQHSDWTYCIVVEGQFDAISIGGCAIMSNQILDEAAQLLGKLNRTIIVVPDRDKAGLTICERALELGYKVSIPNWHPEIKDTNDAVARYGRVPTLLSILEAATSSKILIEMKKRKINE